MKISILLPYKENFVSNHAGAVSLFVNDITKESIYKNDVKIFGNTEFKKYLSKNYINLTFKKDIFKSSNYQYIKSFIKYKDSLNSDIIEVHNRPIYINTIKKNYLNKLFLFFHNDPLQMNGSKTTLERQNLIETIDKIIFNSEWCRKRFFINLNITKKLLEKTSICFQSSSKEKIDFRKKKKIISFVGKLNRSKGYDLFGGAIIKILNKHNDWKAHVYGDEPREKHIFKHKNLKIYGFQKNIKVLNDLKSISISVVCSRWDEPFGRTSLEAASRGSAVIISNKGGLPETSSYAIKIKKLTVSDIYKAIDGLIKDKKKLLYFQKKNYLNFNLTHSYVSKIIDKIRANVFNEVNFKLFYIKKNHVLKIIHVTNFNRRFKGRLHYNTGRRLNNGFIRLGHNVLPISDRDITNENKNISDFNGHRSLQNHLIETFNNFNADCLVLGHADSIDIVTLDYIKNRNKNLKICQWFLDPIDKRGPDYLRNNNRLLKNVSFIDTTFLTTSPSILKNKIDNSYFIPNPADHSFEILKNYQYETANDLFFAMSHGVHRGGLKRGKFDNREIFINKLKKNNKKIIFDTYGMNGVQPVWGDNFLKAISNSNMALNLSRGVPTKYYSSDRIAQLMGNGLLTFIDKKTCFNDFLSNKEIIFYNNIDDLSYKLNKYKKDRKEAKKIAKKGRETYLKHFNSTIVADFILSKTFDFKSKNRFIWDIK